MIGQRPRLLNRTLLNELDPSGYLHRLTLCPLGMKAGLEIECGEGVRVSSSRNKGWPMFGISTDDFKETWTELDIDEYCKVADPREIPFNDDSFDYVVWSDVISYRDNTDILAALREMWRVGNKSYTFRLPFTGDCTMDWWAARLTELHYAVEVISLGFEEDVVVGAFKV